MDLTQTGLLALSLGLGMLVGFQRERAEKRLAGIRTFPLVTLLGTLSAQLAESFGAAVLAGGVVALALVIWSARPAEPPDEARDPGITTEAALLVMFAVGAVVAGGRALPAVVVAGAVALLLHWKRPLHDFVRRSAEGEVRSVMHLVLIGLVLWPALPDRSFGPYAVLNPFEIWTMVVLIVGISLLAHLAQRFLGAGAGTLAAGALGGLVSSTATTVSYARLSRRAPEAAPTAAAVIALASAAVLPRVLLLTAVVAPGALASFAPPLLAMGAGLLALSLAVWLGAREPVNSEAFDHPPSDLRAAVGFGLLYAAVLLAAAAAREHLGEGALYAVAAFSGLTDVDAIALSTLQLSRAGQVGLETGWRLVLVGVLANLVFKGAAAAALGHPNLLGRVAAVFGAALALGVALLYFWPA